MCEATTKIHASLRYGMVLTLILKEFGIPISDQEPKRLLYHTNHYNLKILHHMGFKEENDKWVRKGGRQRTEGADSTIPESSYSESISLMKPQESSTSTDTFQLNDDQLRKIASLVAEKLRRQVLQDNSTLVQLVESIKDEFSKFT